MFTVTEGMATEFLQIKFPATMSKEIRNFLSSDALDKDQKKLLRLGKRLEHSAVNKILRRMSPACCCIARLSLDPDMSHFNVWHNMQRRFEVATLNQHKQSNRQSFSTKKTVFRQATHLFWEKNMIDFTVYMQTGTYCYRRRDRRSCSESLYPLE